MNDKKYINFMDKKLEEYVDNKGFNINRVWSSKDRTRLRMLIALGYNEEEIAILMNRKLSLINDKIEKDLKYSYDVIDDFRILLIDGILKFKN